MATRHQRPPIDWDEALRLHAEEGWSYADIARRFGYAYPSVQQGLKSRGARGRPPPRTSVAARKLHSIWRNTRKKCTEASNPLYASFGAKGIRLSPEWSAFEVFAAWARSSGYRPGLYLARIDERGWFTPSNCRWITQREFFRSRPPPGRKPRVKIDWEKARKLHLENGLSKAAVARRLGASYAGITKVFEAMGASRPRPPQLTTPSECERLRYLWHSMRKRCNNPNSQRYAYFGARGVKLAKEWSQFEPFLRWALATGSKPGLCLTRIDPKRGFSPSNCTWSTSREAWEKQPHEAYHGRQHLVFAFGELKGYKEWEKDPRCRIGHAGLRYRIKGGWHPERAITEPGVHDANLGRIIVPLTAFGVTKSLSSWERDRRCRIGKAALLARIRAGWKPEDAISTPAYKQPARKTSTR